MWWALTNGLLLSGLGGTRDVGPHETHTAAAIRSSGGLDAICVHLTT
jgi:hypothetical protein